MRILVQLAQTAFWMALWFVIPFLLLWPCMAWAVKNTHYSLNVLIRVYFGGITLLWFPTALVTDFLYRKFVLRKPVAERSTPKPASDCHPTESKVD